MVRRNLRATHLLIFFTAASSLTIAAMRLGFDAGPMSMSCADLTALSTSDEVIRVAQTVGPGTFAPSVPTGMTQRALDVPHEFCRVVATLKPSADSDIAVEIWMPTRNWNGKFQAVGNGAFNGTINYAAMVTAIGRRYATASTDTGHVGGGAAWALGHREKVIDFGWRAVHEMTVFSKRVIEAHYGKGARYAYWNGCSAGGRQGMQAAQRFPADYDGIIAGAPGLDWTARAAQALRIAALLEGSPDARLPAEARQLLHDAVISSCDAIDGVKDRLLENPMRCAYDPAGLECKASGQAGCLTSAQVATARAIYETPTNRFTRRPVPGLAHGSELGWTDLGWTASARATGLDQFRFIVFQDPNWAARRFDFETDLARAEKSDANTINALDPDLRPFLRRGGRLIHYHGWADPQIAPGSSTEYYDKVREIVGDDISSGYRLFMAPGMGHCGGGDGPNTFDMLSALEQWVEQGSAPDRIIATHSTKGAADRTRPLCPYPQVAVYSGSGSLDDAARFACQVARASGSV
jgi:feruloyl esterase